MPDLIKGMDVLPTAIDLYNKSIEEDEIASKIDSEFAAGVEAENTELFELQSGNDQINEMFNLARESGCITSDLSELML